MTAVRYVRNLASIAAIPEGEQAALVGVVARYAFRANDYYLSLIDWTDPADPIRRIVIPQLGELAPFGRLDASSEARNYAAPGCQHKYRDTALLLVNEVCGAFCRFCFRKRLFMRGNDEVEYDPSPGIEYIRAHPEITNVLLSGGDPLLLSSRRMDRILSELRGIDHVGIIRIGSKMPAFNPTRISEDSELLAVLASHSKPRKRIYVMTHFNHPRELTDEAYAALDALHRAGVVLANQTPILGGINADADVLAELLRKLSFAGVPPYYFFQCRPTEGNRPFAIPLVQSYQVLRQAMSQVSGLARRARLSMSHDLGKVEVQAVTDDRIICRIHRARAPEDEGRVLIFNRDDTALWLDDLLAQRQVRRQGKAIEAHAHAARRGSGAHFADRGHSD